MQWLIEMFASTSDQARLITTLIAAIIAVAVVLLNQWFNARRARKEKLISKIEEIYAAVIKMQLLKSVIHNEIVMGYPGKHKLQPAGQYNSSQVASEKELEWSRKLDGMRDEFSGLGSVAFMLTGLYFPVLQKNINKIWSKFDNLYLSYVESESLEDYLSTAKIHKDKINISFQETLETLSDIMKKTMH